MASYDLAKQLKANKILIVTNRPAIANSWFDDYEKFIDGYAFISETSSLSNRTTLNREQYLRARKANSVEIVSLLTKPSRRKVDIDVKYVGFESPDEFLVGYGLDYAEKYRNVPFVGVLKREVYEK